MYNGVLHTVRICEDRLLGFALQYTFIYIRILVVECDKVLMRASLPLPLFRLLCRFPLLSPSRFHMYVFPSFSQFPSSSQNRRPNDVRSCLLFVQLGVPLRSFVTYRLPPFLETRENLTYSFTSKPHFFFQYRIRLFHPRKSISRKRHWLSFISLVSYVHARARPCVCVRVGAIR